VLLLGSQSCAFFLGPRILPVDSLDLTDEPHPRFSVQGHILSVGGDGLRITWDNPSSPVNLRSPHGLAFLHALDRGHGDAWRAANKRSRKPGEPSRCFCRDRDAWFSFSNPLSGNDSQTQGNQFPFRPICKVRCSHRFILSSWVDSFKFRWRETKIACLSCPLSFYFWSNVSSSVHCFLLVTFFL
jgi:hypothetical protein